MEKANLKIFIVDDDLKFRKLIKEFLIMKGYNRIVGEASNGEEFLEIFKDVNADIILMDINMPKMNGIKATKIINWEYGNNIKIIALSQYDDFEYMKSMIEAGAAGYVCKSEMGKYLSTAISKVMQGEIYYSDLI